MKVIMGYLNITNIQFKQGNGKIDQPFLLEIKFDCLKDINNSVEWRFVYVSDPDDTSKDQILDQIFMDQLEYGPTSFDWDIPAPNYEKLSSEFDVFDTTVIMLIVLIEGKEFFRCSYFITHNYENPELIENAADKVVWDAIVREIKIAQPVITLKEIAWDELKGNVKEDENLLVGNGQKFQGFDLLG